MLRHFPMCVGAKADCAARVSQEVGRDVEDGIVGAADCDTAIHGTTAFDSCPGEALEFFRVHA